MIGFTVNRTLAFILNFWNLTFFSGALNLLLSDNRVVANSFGLIICARFWIRKTATSRSRESAQCILDVINFKPAGE